MRCLVLLAAALLLNGCATIWEGTSQTVQITTTPVDGAKCDVSNGRGIWTVASTPGDVLVRKDDSELKVDCITPDGRSGGAVLPASVHGVVFANIAIGGVIGMGVDFATGAAWVYPAAGPIALAPPRRPAVTVTPMAAATTTTTTTTTVAAAPTQIAALPKVPTTTTEVWGAGQVQYFKLAQQSIEDLHNKRLLTDTEYLEKMRLLSERYGPQ
ncbi:hypothetical protein [Roseiterribacter gracilis]|uniref:SHOCT domain-containing protein n=1 Tax=Roseiterribacter gracilis TaxID=2812848 RepID=A0A8S8XBZ9_9PROT|nr:hypothetical protein TMPK1_10620 [Rhodospirillales bacterium TMPK1]